MASLLKWCQFMLVLSLAGYEIAVAETRNYNFQVGYLNVTRLCQTKTIEAVNGQFPGPVVYAREGDRVIVNVTNNIANNISIHWHGVRQLFSGWSDGPAYITQCPIQTGRSYVYNFTIVGQRGTLFWHAHISWTRATVHGAIVIKPPLGVPYPFPQPFIVEPVIILGEWWNGNVEQIEEAAIQSGGIPNISDAFTINGQPGSFFNCSDTNKFVQHAIPGVTYLLRIINAALNQDFFFGIANHTLTVVEIDGEYIKNVTVSTLVLASGQTASVLVTANQPTANYYMAAIPFVSAPVPFVPEPATGLFKYIGSGSSTPFFPNLPANNDTVYGEGFEASLRSLNSVNYPANVPQTVDRSLLYTISFNLKPCPPGPACSGPAGMKFAASINNVSFVQPNIAILQANFYSIPGVFTTDFPDNPPNPFDYTGPPIANPFPSFGTKVNVIAFNASVQVVLQDTSILTLDSHPIHLHGFSFYVVGQGKGNYSPANESTFNLVDPPKRNTIAFPAGGWSAIRFVADNPGVWFMHCHLDTHFTWGMETAFLVSNGALPNQSLPSPPADLPTC